MKNYNRDEIIKRLQKNGLLPVYGKKSHILMHFRQGRKRTIGIKLWGYLDFLKVPVRP